MKKNIVTALSVVSCLFAFSSEATAHSVVSPSQTVTSKYETFSLGVPTEREVPTIGVRLLIPEGVDKVTPFVKPGWNIRVTKVGDVATQIEWTGGSIPAGQKDTFQFSARTPGAQATLVWKVYQTYQGGEVVAWDRDPAAGSAGNMVENPYSTTKVVDDTSRAADDMGMSRSSSNTLPLNVAFAALGLSVVALGIALKK